MLSQNTPANTVEFRLSDPAGNTATQSGTAPTAHHRLRLKTLRQLHHWLQSQLQQATACGSLLLIPLPDSASDPASAYPSSALQNTLQRLGKLPLPERQRPGCLPYALWHHNRLQEGYGLPPDQLFALTEQLRHQAPSVLILSQPLCRHYLTYLSSLTDPAEDSIR